MQVFVHPTPVAAGATPDPIAALDRADARWFELIPTAPTAAGRADDLAAQLRAAGRVVVVTLPLRAGTNLRTSAPVQHV